jgi:prepilin-type N-terminal cleavage/methylation domain-containing protein
MRLRVLKQLDLRRSAAFTLIELLVVVAILSLLIAIMIPSLSAARASAKLAACKARLGQLGMAIAMYADENEEVMPHGPLCEEEFDFTCADFATNQLWIGAGNPFHPLERIGLGILLENDVQEKEMYFCPGDDSTNLEEELPRIGTDLDAYGSYTYRQLDMVADRRGALSRLGSNRVNDVDVPVEALALDTNSLGREPFRHTNHKAKRVNVLYRDRSVQQFPNIEDLFSIPAEAFLNPADIFLTLDQILINADYGYRNDPTRAPQLFPPEP